MRPHLAQAANHEPPLIDSAIATSAIIAWQQLALLLLDRDVLSAGDIELLFARIDRALATSDELMAARQLMARLRPGFGLRPDRPGSEPGKCRAAARGG